MLHRPRIAGGVEHSALGVVGEPALPGGAPARVGIGSDDAAAAAGEDVRSGGGVETGSTSIETTIEGVRRPGGGGG